MAKLSGLQVSRLKKILASTSEELGPDTKYITCKDGTRIPLRGVYDPSYRPRLRPGGDKSVILADVLIGLMNGDIEIPPECRDMKDSS